MRRLPRGVVLLVGFLAWGLPRWARAGGSALVVRVVATQTYVRAGPSDAARRVGVVVRGARFPLTDQASGPGCRGEWYGIAPGGYVCSEQCTVERGSPGGPRLPLLPPGKRLPYVYLLVGPDGAGEYASVEDALADSPLSELMPGFGRAARRFLRVEGVGMWETVQGTYLLAQDVFRVWGSRLEGLRVSDSFAFPVAITYERRTTARTAPGRGRRRRLRRYSFWRVEAATGIPGKGLWYRLRGAGWVPAHAVRIADLAEPPPGVGPGQKWVDVDLSQQVLVAYEGRRPVYVTLVSTGRRRSTPVGTFRVWAKLAFAHMESPQDLEPEQLYSMRDVPWTMYFYRGYALHAAYWHDGFGRVRSHGCVNLAPLDARWLFDWSDPRLPAGWRAVLPGPQDTTLVVRIRRGAIARSPERVLRGWTPFSLWPARILCRR